MHSLIRNVRFLYNTGGVPRRNDQTRSDELQLSALAYVHPNIHSASHNHPRGGQKVWIFLGPPGAAENEIEQV